MNGQELVNYDLSSAHPNRQEFDFDPIRPIGPELVLETNLTFPWISKINLCKPIN